MDFQFLDFEIGVQAAVGELLEGAFGVESAVHGVFVEPGAAVEVAFKEGLEFLFGVGVMQAYFFHGGGGILLGNPFDQRGVRGELLDFPFEEGFQVEVGLFGEIALLHLFGGAGGGEQD